MAANGSHGVGDRPNREDSDVRLPDRSELRARLQALPAARPLVQRLAGEPGVFLVGGAVRDLLLGGEPFDLDLVVERDPAPVWTRLDGEVQLHDRFGTATAIVDGFVYDLARARRESYPHPGALPEVRPASLREDLGRRDFTVNAIAVSLATGELHAHPGALDDLGARQLRVLHDGSFTDDPTRLFRLARYRARLSFAIEDRTRALAEAAIGEDAPGTVSGPRIGHELRLLAAERDPVAGLLVLRELGLDRAVHPQFGLEEPGVARRALALLAADGHPGLLAMAVAGRKMSAAALRSLLERLAFPARERDTIMAAATGSDALARRLEEARRPSEIARAAAAAPAEAVALAGALGPAKAASEWLTRLRHVELQIDGRDLQAAGVPAGPALGRALRAALAAKLDGAADSREAELAAALEAGRGG